MSKTVSKKGGDMVVCRDRIGHMKLPSLDLPSNNELCLTKH